VVVVVVVEEAEVSEAGAFVGGRINDGKRNRGDRKLLSTPLVVKALSEGYDDVFESSVIPPKRNFAAEGMSSSTSALLINNSKSAPY
jgi:hypothetical protein